MFTIRNLGGISLFLFGTTFLWLTPGFVTRGISAEGFLWAMTRVLAFITIAGFTVATWGLFRRESWWEGLAVGSAVLGLVVLVPYWIAAVRSGETTPGFNVLIHALGSAGVLILLLVPQLERWVDSHVMGT
jgi:peptidoglycan/LPS O-acetylase OafA/YrhL